MKSYFFLISLCIIYSLCFSQTEGKSKIVLKDKTVLSNIKVWNIYSNKIEYEEKESLHDLLNERIARIETDTSVLSFDESGQLNSRPYDWIIKSNDDTVLCIISQLGGNYIYYYPKGKENRSYIPETSVKKYQVFKPEPVQKLEKGPEPYSPQVLTQDTLKENKIENKSEEVIVRTESKINPLSSGGPGLQNPDSIPLKVENKTEEKTKNPPQNAPLLVNNDFCYDSYLTGEKDANYKSESMWGAGSFCLTGCLGAIPVSAFTLMALNSKQKPIRIPDGVDEKCYLLGYQNQQAKRRVYNTAMGGLVSSVMILGVFFIVYSIGSGGM